jgi:hypothetical protein
MKQKNQNNGRCIITKEENGTNVTYEKITFDQYLATRTDEPFCMVPGGRIFYKPFTTYVSDCGVIELTYGEMEVYILLCRG